MAILGIAAGFLILTLMSGDDAGTGDGVSPSASVSPEDTPPPDPTATPKPRKTPRPTPTLGPPEDFACYKLGRSQTRVTGPAGTKWSLVRLDFRTYATYDRIIYQLERTKRTDDGIEPVALVHPSIPGEGVYIGPFPPWAGDERLNVLLVNGVRDRAKLRSYEPRGMRIVEEVSTYPYRSHVNYGTPEDDPHLADVGTISIVDVLGDSCYALRVVGWDDTSSRAASVYVDVQR
jgi:hypothetical protein